MPQFISSYQSLMFPMDMLPDELQHKILYHLPTDDAIRNQAVCKDWELAIKSWALSTPMAYTPQPQKPLYFSFISNASFDNGITATYAYNTDRKRWAFFKHPISDQELPVPSHDVLPSDRYLFDATTSWGLVCLMDYKSPDNIFVCNPILKNQTRLLPKVPNSFPNLVNCAVTLSTDIHSRKYVVAKIRSHQQHFEIKKYKLTIQLYESEMRTWVNLHSEDSFDWLTCNTCVIHKDTLYIAVRLPFPVDGTQPSHGVVAYNLSQRKQKQFLDSTMVLVPCAFTCVKLLNLNDKLIMVGGIMRRAIPMRLDMKCIKTVGIWEMCGNAWNEIARAPLDAINFLIGETTTRKAAISGCGNLVFLQNYVSGNLLIYELCNDVWKIVRPEVSRNISRLNKLFDGFCFEPRLDIAP